MDENNRGTTFIRLKKSCHLYAREVLEVSLRSILLMIFTAALSALVIFFYEILWQIYQQTYRGQKFMVLYPEAHACIANFLRKELIEVAVQITVAAFAISLVIAAVSQAVYVSRYLFLPLGLFSRVLVWGTPLTILVSMYINDKVGLAHWTHSISLAIVPTLCVFTSCFKFTGALVPEIGNAIVKPVQFLKEIITLPPPQQE